MEHSTDPGSGTIRKANALVAVFAALIVGFLGGVALGVYKTMPATGGTPPAGAPAVDQRQAMAEALEKETAAHPEKVEAWIQLGNLYFDLDEHQRAIGAYEKALALSPGNADVWTDLGVMHRRKGEPRKAVEAFDEAIRRDPGHQVSRFNKGVVLLHDLEDMPGAVAVWEDLLRINPDARTPGGQSVEELVRQMKAGAADRKPAG